MYVMMGRGLLFALALLSGALCLAAGVSYLFVDPTELTVSLLVAFSALGCCALVAAGLWQRVAVVRSRSLFAVGVAGILFAIASGLGIAGARVAHSVRLEPTDLPVALHAAGVMAGVALGVAAFGQLVMVGRLRVARQITGDPVP